MNSIFSTAYFGPVSYFSKLLAVENPLIEAKEHFVKQTIRSRCEIQAANGILQLAVPVIRHNGSKTPIDEVLISYQSDWQKLHWKSIESAYASAPFFEHYGPLTEALIYSQEERLIDLNKKITETIFSWFEISFQETFSESYSSPETCKDLRNHDFQQDEIKPYIQVFTGNSTFHSGLSILDLIFCEGPLARNWITTSQ